MSFILTIILILLFTKVAGDLSVRIGQPAVLGKLIIGVVLGPAVLGWIQPGEVLDIFAEIGVILLMFIAGLETDMEQLKKSWKSALAVAVGGIILPFIGGYLVGIAFGFSVNYSLFFGVIFCATSVSISVQVLKEMNKLSSREGTTILGAAVIDDVLVILLLAFMISIVGIGNDVSIGLMIGKKLLFFVAIVLAGWFAVPKIMKWMAPLRVTEAVVTAALLICFAFVYFAEWLDMAGIIGAFAAGIAVAQTNFRHKVEQKLEPITYAIFVPFFFVSIGLPVSFEGMLDKWWFIIIITIMAVVTKLAGGWLGARLTGFNGRSSLIIGSGMVSRGEVALIIGAIGLQAGLVQPEYYTSIVIMVIITTLVTPPLLKLFYKKDVDMPQKGDL